MFPSLTGSQEKLGIWRARNPVFLCRQPSVAHPISEVPRIAKWRHLSTSGGGFGAVTPSFPDGALNGGVHRSGRRRDGRGPVRAAGADDIEFVTVTDRPLACAAARGL